MRLVSDAAKYDDSRANTGHSAVGRVLDMNAEQMSVVE